MSDGWRFCPSSEPAVEEIRRVSIMDGPREERNKWLAEFKEQHKDNPFGMSMYNLLRTSATNRDKREDVAAGLRPPRTVHPTIAYCDAIEAEPVARFDYMLEEGSKNNSLLRVLAERLTGRAAERICKHLFDSRDSQHISIQHIDSFFRHFLPIYLKRAYSWFSLDIMVKANKSYPLAFRTLLQILLQDLEISNTMINDFVLTLDETGKYEFMSTVMELELSTDEFVHNLVSITTAYKSAEKTERLQSYIFNSLVVYSGNCLADWNYGRLLLAYLHAVSNGQKNFDIRTVERLIEMHRSPFKRPCMSVLSDAIKALNEAAIPPNPT